MQIIPIFGKRHDQFFLVWIGTDEIVEIPFLFVIKLMQFVFILQEMKKIAEERRREKQETRLAKERVKAQIAQDRAARVQKDAEQNLALGAASGRGPAQTCSQPPVIPVAGSDKSSSSSEVEYSETRLQIRQIDGTPLVQTFKAKEPLSAVRLYVQMNRKDIPGGPVKLMTAFPRKVFEEEDYQQPLASLGLVPSAVLIISR